MSHGIVATTGFLTGVAVATFALSQKYWVGPMVKAVGEEYASNKYPPLRYWALK